MNQTNKDTYEEIAEQFSETRAYVWQCVKDFTNLITDKSNILEIGCGNGKNMEYILKSQLQVISVRKCFFW